MRKLLIPLVVGVTVFFSQVATEVSAQTPEYFTPELTQDLGSTVIDVNGDPEALAAVCARISAGEIVEGVVYDCSVFPAFQIVCTDPERSSMDCFPDATPAPDTCWDCKTPTLEALPVPELTPEPTPTVVPTPEATETVVAP